MQLVLDEQLRAIERQGARLDEVRARIGGLLGTAAIATSFLGAAALDGSRDMTFWLWVAVALFVAITVVSLDGLRPRTWHFVHRADRMIEGYVDANWTIDDMARAHAEALSEDYGKNEKVLSRLYTDLTVGLVALAALVVILLLDLGLRG